MSYMRTFYRKYKHLFPLAIFLIFYLTVFVYVENRPAYHMHLLASRFDHLIPFCELFVVPYIMWFFYITFGVLFFGIVDNVFTRLVIMIYSSDTSTNVFPSIHVFNTIAMHTAVRHSTTLKKHPWAVRISGIIAVSIVLSTMFIKQHTVIDVVGAMGLNLVTWYVLYRQPQFLTNLREKLVREK